MMSPYLNVTDTIIHLVVDKSLMIGRSDLPLVKKVIRDNNYRNFVGCSKIKQAEFFELNLKMYKTAPFDEWCDYFAMD